MTSTSLHRRSVRPFNTVSSAPSLCFRRQAARLVEVDEEKLPAAMEDGEEKVPAAMEDGEEKLPAAMDDAEKVAGSHGARQQSLGS
jgi:hypothetical protein